MKFQAFISKINWRQMLVHFFAFLFFVNAFKAFSLLYNIELLDAIRLSEGNIENTTNRDFGEISNYLVFFRISGLIGLLVAFIISTIISIKKKWLWINTLIPLLLVFSLNFFKLSGWGIIKIIASYTANLLNNSAIEYSLTGIILLIIGLFFFFGKTTNNYITSNLNPKL